MPERASIAQSTQIGVEAVMGTAVAANKRLAGLSITPGIKGEFNSFKPEGMKFPTVTYLGKEWSDSKLSGTALYSELQYPLASVITSPTVAAITDGTTPTGAHRWTFDPKSLDTDTPRAFTVEFGSSARAHRASHVLVSDFDVKWSRNSVELGGSAFGKSIQDGVGMTPNPTSIAEVPVIPTQLDVFLDPTVAGLGTTKLGRALSGSFSIQSRYAPLWVVDSAQPSFASFVEVEPKVQMTVLMEADAEGMGLLDEMRGGVTSFLRLQATGERIYTGATAAAHVNHLLRIDVAGKIIQEPPYSDADGVYAIEYTLGAHHDSGWNRAFRVELVNKSSAL